MNQTCTYCDASFEIANEDIEFHKRASPIFSGIKCQIPRPTRCPQCRNTRRMAWRNDRSFYLRKCDLTGKGIISIYPDQTPFPVYQHTEWYSDKWDPMNYGQEIDFSRPFFEQWHELMKKVPRMSLDLVNCQNSDYCNYCGDDKNCYLDIAGEANEDCYYNLFVKYSRNCVDCTFCYHSTLCYESILCHHCYDVRYSTYLDTCSECFFCHDLKGCNRCLFCLNLRNKEYYIYNQPCTKEEYERRVRELQLTSYRAVAAANEEWQHFRLDHGIYRDMYTSNSENCSGNDITNSKNCANVFNATNCWDCKYLYDVLDAKDCYDLNYSLYKPELSYELISTLQLQHSAFNMASHYCANIFYCDLTNNSHDLFGCISLNHKEYCILNKQYTKDEYDALAPRLIKQMERHGEWGEFFPETLSPFCYNETVAQEYAPITEQEAFAKGCRWKQPKTSEYPQSGAVIADDIRNVEDGVTADPLSCASCRKAFRVIKQELSFFRQGGIPLPQHCPDCRHLRRLNLRTLRKLWDRLCAKCKTPIVTVYSAELQEQIYCERCYLMEVY